MIANTSSHCRGDTQGLMNPAEIVVHVMERHRVLQILKFLGESICQASKSAHRHAHGQILSLNVACGDMVIIGTAADNRLASAYAYSRTTLIIVLRAPMHIAGLYRVSGVS